MPKWHEAASCNLALSRFESDPVFHRNSQCRAESVAIRPGNLAYDNTTRGGSGGMSMPEGWHNVTPRIVANGAEELVAFVKGVFGARGEYLRERPSEIWIGDSVIMISDAGEREPMAAVLFVYVDD